MKETLYEWKKVNYYSVGTECLVTQPEDDPFLANLTIQSVSHVNEVDTKISRDEFIQRLKDRDVSKSTTKLIRVNHDKDKEKIQLVFIDYSKKHFSVSRHPKTNKALGKSIYIYKRTKQGVVVTLDLKHHNFYITTISKNKHPITRTNNIPLLYDIFVVGTRKSIDIDAMNGIITTLNNKMLYDCGYEQPNDTHIFPLVFEWYLITNSIDVPRIELLSLYSQHKYAFTKKVIKDEGSIPAKYMKAFNITEDDFYWVSNRFGNKIVLMSLFTWFILLNRDRARLQYLVDRLNHILTNERYKLESETAVKFFQGGCMKYDALNVNEAQAIQRFLSRINVNIDIDKYIENCIHFAKVELNIMEQRRSLFLSLGKLTYQMERYYGIILKGTVDMSELHSIYSILKHTMQPQKICETSYIDITNIPTIRTNLFGKKYELSVISWLPDLLYMCKRLYDSEHPLINLHFTIKENGIVRYLIKHVEGNDDCILQCVTKMKASRELFRIDDLPKGKFYDFINTGIKILVEKRSDMKLSYFDNEYINEPIIQKLLN